MDPFNCSSKTKKEIESACNIVSSKSWKWFGKGRKHCCKRKKNSSYLAAFSPLPTTFSKGCFPRSLKPRTV